MSNTHLALTTPLDSSGREMWQTMLDQAKTLVESGFLPKDLNTPAKAAAVILKGRELRIPAMYACSNIVIVNGKPTVSAELLLALLYRDHGDEAVWFTESTAERCTLSYQRRGWPTRRTHTFTMDEAKQAGLLNNPTWQKYPAAMLRARCISGVARLAFPDSIAGLYTPEELGADVTVDAATGEITTVTPVSPPPARMAVLTPGEPPRGLVVTERPAVDPEVVQEVKQLRARGLTNEAIKRVLNTYHVPAISDLGPDELTAFLIDLHELADALESEDI